MIRRAGATSEIDSAITIEQLDVIEDTVELQRGAGGPMVSPEVVVIAALPLAKTGTDANVQVRGVRPSALEVHDKIKIVEGRFFTPGLLEMVVGKHAKQAYAGLAMGDQVKLGGTAWTVVGTFDSGHFEYDSAMALLHIGDAARLFRVDGPTGVRVKIADMQRAPEVAEQLAKSLPPNLLVRDWTRQNRSWFAAVQVEKRMMFIILALIVAVAAFNLVSTLVMTVTEKQPDIAILRTLGATPRSVMAVFIVQGALIGVFGTLLGVAGGLFLANNLDSIFPTIERIAGFPLIPKDIYFISSLPSDPRASDVVPIAVISILLSLVATLYPSWRASRVRPAEALRYAAWRRSRRPPGRDRRDRRRIGLRQEHAVARSGWSRFRGPWRGADRRARAGALERRRKGPAAQRTARLRLPVPSPVAGVHSARQCRNAADDPSHGARAGARASWRSADCRRPRGARTTPPDRAFGWRAPTHGDCACDRHAPVMRTGR